MKNLILPLLLLVSISSVRSQTKLLKADGYVDVVSGKLINPANILIENYQHP